MSVSAKYAIDAKQIADMQLSITLTMSVSDWGHLMTEQSHAWPACDLKAAIAEALSRIQTATTQTYHIPRDAS